MCLRAGMLREAAAASQHKVIRKLVEIGKSVINFVGSLTKGGLTQLNTYRWECPPCMISSVFITVLLKLLRIDMLGSILYFALHALFYDLQDMPKKFLHDRLS